MIWELGVYGMVVPAIAVLVALRRPRARFSAYLFLSFELLRGLSAGSVSSILLALGGIALFQLPSMTRLYPRIDARKTLLARALRAC